MVYYLWGNTLRQLIFLQGSYDTVNAVVAEAAGFSRDRRSFSHSLRGQAAEKGFYAGLPVKDIMAAAVWKSELVFTQFYFQPALNTVFGCAVLSKTAG